MAFKPRYTYGETKTNYSESHQEYRSQSNYVDSAWAGKVAKPSYNYQAQENKMGRVSANKSTNYYAQAQCAQPSPSINVVQGTHVVETVKREESIKGGQLGVGSPKCNRETQPGHFELGLQQEEHMMGKMDQGWTKKSDHVSGGAQYGLTMHKDEHMIGKTEQGWANKPTQCSSPKIGNQEGLVIHEEEHLVSKVESGVTHKPSQFSGANQYGQSVYKEHGDAYNYSEGGVKTSWATKPSKHKGSVHSDNTGFGVHKEDNMMGKIDQSWVISPKKISKSSHSNMDMYKEDVVGNMGYEGHKPSNFSSPTKTNNNGLKMYEEEHIMEKSDNLIVNPSTHQLPGLAQGNQYGQYNDGWANKPGKYSGVNQDYSGQDMYKEQGHLSSNGIAQNGYGVSQVNHSAHGVVQSGFGSSQVNHSAHGIDQNGYGVSKHGYGAGVVNHSTQGGFGSGQTNHTAYGVAQNGFGISQDEYGAGQVNHLAQSGYGASQVNHSAQSGYGSKKNSVHGVAQNGFGVAQNMYGSGQVNHSAHGIASNGYGVGQTNHSSYNVSQNGYGAGQANQLAYGGSKNMYGTGQEDHSTHRVSQNEFGAAQANYSAHGMAKNGFEAILANYSTHGMTQNGYEATQANYSAHGAQNYQDHEECDEGVHDIMDEILTKYPSHSVSGGHGENWGSKHDPYVGQTHGASYAKQQSFEMKKEVKGGLYMANMNF